MTRQQKKAATAVSLIFIAIPTIILAWLAALIMTGGHNLLGAHIPGRLFMLMIHNESSLTVAFKSLPYLITFGMTLLATSGVRNRIFYGIVGVSVIGILASVYILIEASAIDTARRFWQDSPVPALDTYQTFTAAVKASVIPFIVWFVGILACQLGIVLKSERGTAT